MFWTQRYIAYIESAIDVRDYLNEIHEIRDTNASCSIDPLQTREWARKYQRDPFTPLLTKIQSS